MKKIISFFKLLAFLSVLSFSSFPTTLFAQQNTVITNVATDPTLYLEDIPGAYVPLIMEGPNLSQTGLKIDLDMSYLLILGGRDRVDGFSFGGNLTTLMNNVHEFGGALSWSTFSTNRIRPNKPTFGWEGKLGFIYRFNKRYKAFAFNYGVQAGPAIFSYQEDPNNASLHFLFYIQPEMDFEIRILDHFSTSFRLAYSMHLPVVGMDPSPFISHLIIGVVWRWYDLK